MLTHPTRKRLHGMDEGHALERQVKELTKVEDGWMSEQIQWHENGQKLSHSRFKKANAKDLTLTGMTTGKERKVVFENDKMKGKIIHWHKNGQKRKEGQYINGTASEIGRLGSRMGRRRRNGPMPLM